jgi:hypothetical protein
VKKQLAVLSFLAIMFATIIVPIYASKLTATVTDDHVHVVVKTNLYQNVTTFPSINLTITSTTNVTLHSMMNSSFAKAIKAQYVHAKVKNLNYTINSNDNWLNVTIELDLYNVMNKTEDGIPTVNCRWKAFNVTDDLRIGSLAINFVGKFMLFNVVHNLVHAPGVKIYVNKTVVAEPATAMVLVNKASLLNFRALRKPLQYWNRTYDSVRNVTIWTYDAGATIDLKIETADGTIYVIHLDPSGEIIAEGDIQAQDDTIIIPELPSTIILTLLGALTLVAATFVKRKTPRKSMFHKSPFF